MQPGKYLVTGGAGFIGSSLCGKLLREGDQVVVLDDFNDYYDPAVKEQNLHGLPLEIVRGDIRDEDLVMRTFASHRFDGVFHFAARAGVRPSISNPRLYFGTNVDGTLNLLEAARRHEVRDFIFASSSSVYGVNSKVPFAESDPIPRTISPYAASKLAGEQLCSNYAHLFGLRCMCLRFFTVYGPRQRPDLAISKFTKSLLAGKTIDRYGDGTTTRDYTYVDDLVEGVLAAKRVVKNTSFEICNLGGSVTTSLNELIALLEQTTGRRAIIRQLAESAGDMPRTCADISKAAALLNYQPKTRLKDGIALYVNWHRSNDQAASCA